ncbi:alpha/beta hydrolase [Actinophytocola gossypii]|uniref:Alpha/beta fold hydrolase n=1 Tax=Actinophytocola gossypii TaxID=2812003 RepID=A0ABT2JGI4_9PSEU|nr:alpha/beta fold hydrolase [Actinophytocola gossypii]
MNRVVAATAAACAVLGGLVMAPTAGAAAPEKPRFPEFVPEPVQWGECDDPRLVAAGAECGFVSVPLDYRHPNGEKIQLAVSRVLHKTPDRQAQGPMLVNPGGPGGSGLVYAAFGGLVPDGAGDAYDWIGFDPRGVGASEPSLSCVPDHDGYDRPFYVPVKREYERAWLRRSENYADACEADGGSLLDHMTTVESALDVESIRKALGAERINYYGFSYGTYLGQVYATMFPDRLDRVVFDGNVDPTRVWYRSNLDQDLGFDHNIEVYFDWVAEHDGVYHLGTTGREVERRYYTELAGLVREPAGGIIGPDEWADIFLQAAYYVYGWEDVATAFAGWVHDRDWEPLRDLYGTPPFDDNTHAVYLAVVCTDAPWTSSYPRYKFDNWVTHFRAPFATWGNAWFNAPCLTWPARSHRPVDVDGSGVDSALLINETHDAATPYEGALEVRERFPNAVLVEGVNGTTHSGSLSGVECTDSIIVEYLRTGTLPARQPGNRSDVRCDPVPEPAPAGAADRRTESAGPADLRRELAETALPR